MRRFGIIGKPLEHSFSALYFADKFQNEKIDADYRLYEIDDLSEIPTLMQQLHGFNVTYPYKQSIMKYLSDIDEVAQTIGAVNVIHNGKGYNTDWIGFRESIAPYLSDGIRVMVLGTGGVSKAVQYALKQMNVAYTLVSRKPQTGVLTYDAITEEIMQQHTVLVNCTPLGMLPDVNSKPNLPYDYITHAHMLYDCVYNPHHTAFLCEGEKRGAKIMNGLQMLYLQADAAWEIWK